MVNIVEPFTGAKQPRSITTTRYTPIARMMYDISGVLRRDFRMSRLQAEWLVFRLASKVEYEHRNLRADAYTIAQFAYIAWSQHYSREWATEFDNQSKKVEPKRRR